MIYSIILDLLFCFLQPGVTRRVVTGHAERVDATRLC